MVGLVHDKSRVDLKVPTSSDLYLHVDSFDDGVICPDCVRSWTWLVPAETIGFVAHATLKRQSWTSVDKRGHCPKHQNFCFSGCNYIDACVRCSKTKRPQRNDCNELDEDGLISDE